MFERVQGLLVLSVIWAGAGTALGQASQPATPARRTPPETSAVPPAQWGKLPPIDWAKILFTPELGLPGSRTVSAGQAFLVRAPTGQTLAVSPYFSTGDVDPSDPKAPIQSWTLRRKGTPAVSVRLGTEMVPADACQSLHCMITVCKPLPSGVGTVLEMATGPAPIHKRGLFVVPNGKAKQAGNVDGFAVYTAIIIGPDAHHTPGRFCFGINSRVDPKTMQSGVVLDEQGRVLGLQTGYYPESYHSPVIICSATDVPALVEAAKLPALPAVEAAVSAPRPAMTNKGSSPTTAPATAVVIPSAPKPPTATPAEKALRLARMYEASDQYGPARTKLQQVIDSYPNTPSAAEAKADLQAIQGK